MQPPPKLLDGAEVVCWAVLDPDVKPTGYCRHFVGGMSVGPGVALAICCYPLPNQGFYLFQCDEHWRVLTDTYHDTPEEAKRQAEFEFEGVTAYWRTS